MHNGTNDLYPYQCNSINPGYGVSLVDTLWNASFCETLVHTGSRKSKRAIQWLK